ncbi:MAG TPA: penicillin-binding transpeptidase domain-containing protein [Acidimicrobiales bacterium]|jgi:peptidoglycan glycosyltransferase|nr:penicillin-binding transpeptidase domain-containing protein [Acidimicrobiales bacterium]
MEKRIRRLGIFMVLCFVALFIQLNNIQVLKAHSLATSSKNPAVIQAARTQPRGEILSSNGTALAQSVLAPPSDYYKYQRVYPAATAGLFVNVVGWDSPRVGQLGAEASYNQYLEAHNRAPKTLRDLLTSNTVTDNVTLTLGDKLQQTVATDITQLPAMAPPEVPVGNTQASAVVIDPKTGAVLAMYSTPTYDPNPLVSQDGKAVEAAYQAEIHAPGNPVLAKAYEDTNAPGSTFKVVTSAAVYDHNPPVANVDYPQVGCLPAGTIPDTSQQLCNYGAGSPQGPELCGGTLQQSLPESCDTAFAQMGLAVGAPGLNSEAVAFGFDQVPPLDLPGAVKSSFPSVPELTPPFLAYSAFGQENVTASALQMAMVAGAIANDGVVMTPHVMAQIRDSQGNLVQTYTPKPWVKATTPSTASQVQSLMQAVVSMPGATAYGAFPADEAVAAKTGTAQVGSKAQYTSDWMIAYSTKNPNVAVAVVAPYQHSDATGAKIVGPVTCAILQVALNPDAPEACPGS